MMLEAQAQWFQANRVGLSFIDLTPKARGHLAKFRCLFTVKISVKI